MRDGCWVPGCSGEIIPSREIRSTVARHGECSVCGARYQSFGRADWKFEKERHDCLVEGCDGYVEFDRIPGKAAEARCWKCDATYRRDTEGQVTTA